LHVMVMCMSMRIVVFFFSSRRRHTRSKRDWSSDVCSSDLHWGCRFGDEIPLFCQESLLYLEKFVALARAISERYFFWIFFSYSQIGRASCRESVFISDRSISFI